MEVSPVPPAGAELELGSVYSRAELHDRFGGNRTCGIVPSTLEPVILLFHTEEPAIQFYSDGHTPSGLYRYSGMGLRGDMAWNYANIAIRDHVTAGRRLLLFERAQRKDGLWRFAAELECARHCVEHAMDIEGRSRLAIIFYLERLRPSA